MKNGIKAKDIRDFNKCVEKLNGIMERIREYKPEAHIYATPGSLNLMSGVLDGRHSACEEQEQMMVVAANCAKLEAGDW